MDTFISCVVPLPGAALGRSEGSGEGSFLPHVTRHNIRAALPAAWEGHAWKTILRPLLAPVMRAVCPCSCMGILLPCAHDGSLSVILNESSSEESLYKITRHE